jgi:hypothetical protein
VLSCLVPGANVIFFSVLFELEYRERLNGIKSKQNHIVKGQRERERDIFSVYQCIPYRRGQG